MPAGSLHPCRVPGFPLQFLPIARIPAVVPAAQPQSLSGARIPAGWSESRCSSCRVPASLLRFPPGARISAGPPPPRMPGAVPAAIESPLQGPGYSPAPVALAYPFPFCRMGFSPDGCRVIRAARPFLGRRISFVSDACRRGHASSRLTRPGGYKKTGVRESVHLFEFDRLI